MFKRIKKESKIFSKKVRGVGVNDDWYQVYYKHDDGQVVKCPYYRKWESMLERCYCPKYQEREPTYKGCSVDPFWLSFTNFRVWMESQDWKGKHLDKDVIKPNNKIYSPLNCAFISQSLNNLMTNKSKGAFYNTNKSRFIAQISKHGKKVHIGNFKNERDAINSYKKEKIKYIKELMTVDHGSKVLAGLSLYVKELES